MEPVNTVGESTKGVLTLLQLPGVGPKTTELLVREFSTLDEIRVAAASGNLPTVSARSAKSLSDRMAWLAAIDRAQLILDQAANLRVRILTAFEEGYPHLL